MAVHRHLRLGGHAFLQNNTDEEQPSPGIKRKPAFSQEMKSSVLIFIYGIQKKVAKNLNLQAGLQTSWDCC